MYHLPAELQRIIYSYDPTYRYKYDMVMTTLRVFLCRSWTYRSEYYYYKDYANYNILPSKVKGNYICSYDDTR